DVYDHHLLDMKKGDECVDGHWEGERSTARFELVVVDTGFCSEAPGLHLNEVIAGAEEASRPPAEALLSRLVPERLRAVSFPWQARVVVAGSPARAEAP